MFCELCLRTSASPPNRYGGIDLCNHCSFGGALAAATARGFKLVVNCFAVGSSKTMTFFARGVARVHPPAFDAHFRRKGFGDLFRRVFTRSVRLPDALFHEIGRIESRDPATVLEFMSEEGPQSIIMEMIAEDVRIWVSRTGVVRVRGRRTSGAFDATRLELSMSVLMVHLEQFVGQQGD